MGKWIGIIVGLAIVLGVGGYAIYRWTDMPERAQGWMDEQDLKNFPTQAKRELDSRKKELDEWKGKKKAVEVDIIKREGREDWSDENLKAEINGLACIAWYEKQTKKYDAAINDIVSQVKKQQKEQVDNSGGAIARVEDIDPKFEYAITVANGSTTKWTLAKAQAETDKLAKDKGTFERKMKLQKGIVEKKKAYVAKMGELVTNLEKKIEEMEIFIEEMTAELETLQLEKDIEEINKSINGQGGESRFGKSIAKFREKQKEFLAEKELAASSKPADDGYFSESDTPKEAGASSSYWK